MILTLIKIATTAKITHTHNKTKESNLKTTIHPIKAIRETAIEINAKIDVTNTLILLFSFRDSPCLSL